MPRRSLDRHARLGWLVGSEFEFVPGLGPNRKAADATVRTLKSLGRLEDVDAALVTAFRMLAEGVDCDPTNSGLWNQYRAAEVALRAVGSSSDALSEFLRTTLGDTSNV